MELCSFCDRHFLELSKYFIIKQVNLKKIRLVFDAWQTDHSILATLLNQPVHQSVSGDVNHRLVTSQAIFFLFLFIIFFFLWLHLQHMEVPRLGVESELQLLAFTTATAMWDLRRSLQQCRILNH